MICFVDSYSLLWCKSTPISHQKQMRAKSRIKHGTSCVIFGLVCVKIQKALKGKVLCFIQCYAVFSFSEHILYEYPAQYSRISQAGYSEQDFSGYPRVCWAHYFRWIPSTFCSSSPINFSEQIQFRLSKRVESIWTSPTNTISRFTIPHKFAAILSPHP